MAAACGGAGTGTTLPETGNGNGGDGGNGGGPGNGGSGGDDGGVVKGACTKDKPCVIHTIEQLQAIGESFTYPKLIERDEPLKGHYILGRDIDASQTKDWTLHGAKGFIPIGASERSAFEGSIDGDGHTITGLHIEFSGNDGIGLFGVVGEHGVIRNMKLARATVKGGPGDALLGTLAGLNKGTVVDVSVEGEILFERPSHDGKRGAHIGGLVGLNEGTIENASTGIVLTSQEAAGGLVGLNAVGGEIRGSDSKAQVFGFDLDPLGGLVAINEGVIDDSHTLSGAKVIATRADKGWVSQVGGLVGENKGEIKFSTAAATVEGYSDVGGLVGRNGGRIEDSASSGAVTGYNTALGGLVGMNKGGDALIARSYSTGSVFGKVSYIDDRAGDPVMNMGGLVGTNQEGAKIVDSYSTASLDGDTSLGGVGGLAGTNAQGTTSNKGVIETSYSTGALPVNRGHDDVGGLVGGHLGHGGGNVLDSFWDTEASGTSRTAPGAGTGKTRDEMKDPQTFKSAGWIDDVWDIQSDAYPRLRNTPRPDGS